MQLIVEYLPKEKKQNFFDSTHTWLKNIFYNKKQKVF